MLVSEVANGVKKPAEPIGNAVGDASFPVLKQVRIEGRRSSGSKVPRAGMDGADLVFLRQRIQGLQAENDDLFSRRKRHMMMEMDMLLKIRSEKKNLSRLELKVRNLTKLMAKSRTEQEKLAGNKQGAETSWLRSPVMKNVFRSLDGRFCQQETGHAQALQVRDDEVNKLSEQGAKLDKKVDGSEYEPDRARALLQQLQGGQQTLHSVVSRAQIGIDVLGAGLEKDGENLPKRQDTIRQHMSVTPGNVLSRLVMMFENKVSG